MEKLTAAQQQQIKKMFNDRLRVKLMAAGYEEDEVLGYGKMISCRCTLVCWLAANLKLGQSVMILSWREKLAFEKAKYETEQKRWEAEMEAKGLKRRKESVKKSPKQSKGNAEKNASSKRRNVKKKWSLKRRKPKQKRGNAEKSGSLKSVNAEKR